MASAAPERERADPALTLMARFGCAASSVLADSSCRRFWTPMSQGVIPYRMGPRCRVAIGDPVCRTEEADELAEAFRKSCGRDGDTVVYAATSEAFAMRCVQRGYAAVEFAHEIILDPRHDRLSGAAGRELRKKVHRAEHDGVVVREHRDSEAVEVEHALRVVASAWLARRRGPQAFIVPLGGFTPAPWRRCFYALAGGRAVGGITLMRVGRLDGWSIEHLVHLPGGPVGVSELLVTHAMRAIADDGATAATFGPSRLPQLGRVFGIGRTADAGLRLVFDVTERLFSLGAIDHFRAKFGVARCEPSFLLFYPGVSVLSTYGLIHAFSAH